MPILQLPQLEPGWRGWRAAKKGCQRPESKGWFLPSLGRGGLTLTPLGSGGVQEEDLPCLGLQLLISFSG